MRATGMVRKVDKLGRVTLPKGLRRVLDIEVHDGLAIYVENDQIILCKYEPARMFCGNANKVTNFKGKANMSNWNKMREK